MANCWVSLRRKPEAAGGNGWTWSQISVRFAILSSIEKVSQSATDICCDVMGEGDSAFPLLSFHT